MKASLNKHMMIKFDNDCISLLEDDDCSTVLAFKLALGVEWHFYIIKSAFYQNNK
jgi:hypothetical protein